MLVKALGLGSGILLAALAAAQVAKPVQIFRELRAPEVVREGRVALLGPGNQVISEWRDFGPTGARSVWAKSFDTMSFNELSGQPYTGIYGQTPGFFRFANNYRNPYFAVDIERMFPGSEGQPVTRFVTDIVWNPGGGYERSGSGRLAMAVFCANSFGLSSNGLSFSGALGLPIPGTPYNGVVIDFGVQPHGWRTYDANLGAAGLSLPTPSAVSPASPGAVVVVLGTINAQGQFQLAPQTWAMQPTMDNMCAANDPNYPGVNPSQSGPLQWDDDGGSLIASVSNGLHDNLTSTVNLFTELYTYDWASNNLGFPQASVALLRPASGGRWAGQANSQAPVRLVDVTLVASNSSGTPLPTPGGQLSARVQTVSVDTASEYEVADPALQVQGGGIAQHVFVVGGGRAPYLRKVVGPVPLYQVDQLPPLQLVAGDLNADNTIDLTDLDLGIGAYLTEYGDAGWIAEADLNADGSIDLSDLDIIIGNYLANGDPMPTLP